MTASMTAIATAIKSMIEQNMETVSLRNETDGWIYETVIAYDYDNPPIIFYYKVNIPEDAARYGYNYYDKP